MSEVLLKVPYFSQVDNDTDYHGSGYRQCNLTTHAMAVDFLTKGALSQKAKELGFAEPESYYGKLLAPYGDTIDHTAHTRCIEEKFGLRSQWRTDLDISAIGQQLEQGKPVPVGVAYKQSGHIVLVVGRSDRGLKIHDPYGIRYGATSGYDVGANGANDEYSWHLLNQVYWDLGSCSGWGRIFT